MITLSGPCTSSRTLQPAPGASAWPLIEPPFENLTIVITPLRRCPRTAPNLQRQIGEIVQRLPPRRSPGATSELSALRITDRTGKYHRGTVGNQRSGPCFRQRARRVIRGFRHRDRLRPRRIPTTTSSVAPNSSSRHRPLVDRLPRPTHRRGSARRGSRAALPGGAHSISANRG